MRVRKTASKINAVYTTPERLTSSPERCAVGPKRFSPLPGVIGVGYDSYISKSRPNLWDGFKSLQLLK